MKLVVSANIASNICGRKNLLLALQQDGWDILAAGCDDGGANGLAEMGIPFHTVPMQNKGMNMLADLRTFFSFLRLYRIVKPDAVLHFNSKPGIYGSMAANMLGIQSISNITGLGAVYVGPDNMVRKIVNILYRIAFSGKKSFVFFQNTDDRNLFVELRIVNPEATGLLPGSGVDINVFAPGTLHTEASNEPGETGFLFASRLVLAKGIMEFIRAAERVQSRFPGTRFDIIGELLDYKTFMPREELDRAIAAGIVSYHGNVADTKKWISRADCIVLPSYYREGVPRILLEAAAMGKPLIAADSVGTREPVEENVNGFLCKPRSVDDLTDCMIRFIETGSNERIRMGRASRTIAIERFSDSIVSKRYLDVLVQGRKA